MQDSPPVKDRITTLLVSLVSFACVAAAIIRTIKQAYLPDRDVLLFLVAAALVPFFERISKFKFGGLEFEKRVEELTGRVDELADINDEPATPAPPDLPEATTAAETQFDPDLFEVAAEELSKKIHFRGQDWSEDLVPKHFEQSSLEGVDISAKVTASLNFRQRYIVRVWLRLSEDKAPKNPRVAFFLHHTFKNPMRLVDIEEGNASLRLMTRGEFVIGALLPDGSRVKLDLRNVTMDLTDEQRRDFLSH